MSCASLDDVKTPKRLYLKAIRVIEKLTHLEQARKRWVWWEIASLLNFGTFALVYSINQFTHLKSQANFHWVSITRSYKSIANQKVSYCRQFNQLALFASFEWANATNYLFSSNFEVHFLRFRSFFIHKIIYWPCRFCLELKFKLISNTKFAVSSHKRKLVYLKCHQEPGSDYIKCLAKQSRLNLQLFLIKNLPQWSCNLKHKIISLACTQNSRQNRFVVQLKSSSLQ